MRYRLLPACLGPACLGPAYLGMAIALAAPVAAQDKAVPEARAQIELSFATVVK